VPPLHVVEPVAQMAAKRVWKRLAQRSGWLWPGGLSKLAGIALCVRTAGRLRLENPNRVGRCDLLQLIMIRQMKAPAGEDRRTLLADELV
jgi:hypothetical protein